MKKVSKKYLWQIMVWAGLIALIGIEANAAKTKKISIRNAKKILDYPNFEDVVRVGQIQRFPQKNLAMLYSVQLIRGEKKYSFQDDYHERKFVCEAFDFQGPAQVTAPITAKERASGVIGVAKDGETLKPLRKGNMVSMLDMIPCQIN